MPRKARYLQSVSKINANISLNSNWSSLSALITPEENFPRASTPQFDEQTPVLEFEGNAEISRISNDEIPETIPENQDSASTSAFKNSISIIAEAESQPVWVTAGLKCKITEDDLLIMLVAIQGANRLSDAAMDSYCALLNVVLPEGHTSPASYRKVIQLALKKFANFGGKLGYICSSKNCAERLQKQFDSCSRVECSNFRRVHQTTGYVNFKVQPQIELLVRKYMSEIRREIEKARTVPSSSVCDILSSKAYQCLHQNSSENELNISLILSSDGAQPFKCGGASLWPCVAIIAELPPKVRAAVSNCLVFGFWIGNRGNTKPNWRLFLESTIAELNFLRYGFDMESDGYKFRVRVSLFGTLFDLPAQASIWAHKQYNGAYGCMACYAPGQRIQGSKLQVWPKTRDKRAKTRHFYKVAWASLTVNPTVPYRGVTAVSPLSKLINPADANIFDPMHMVYRGNAVIIFNRFFRNEHGRWPSLFKPKQLQELSNDLAEIKFPIEFNRTIPKLEYLATFKASELKNLLIYGFLPATAPFMQSLPDYWHWAAIFVHAIRLLSQETVTEDDISLAKAMIDVWQRLIPELASEFVQNFNAHGVQHLPAQVLKFGPLWAVSAFCFESFNGDFVARINSAKGPVQQVARRFILQRYAMTRLEEIRRERPQMEAIISKVLGAHKHKFGEPACQPNVKLGTLSSSFPDADMQHALLQAFHFNPQNVKYSAEVYVNGTRFDSTSKCSSRSCVFRYSIEYIIPTSAYASALVFVCIDKSFYAIASKLKMLSQTNIRTVPPPSDPSLLQFYDAELYGSFFPIVQATDELIVVSIEDITCKAVLIPYYDDFIVSDVLPFEHN